MWNNLKTTFLLAALTGLLLVIGQFWGGQNGMKFALILAAVMNLGSYFFSDKIALRMSGAQPIAREENPRIYQIVERLAAKANVPVPKIYFIPTDSPNAFATGRNPSHASVAVTRGILELAGAITLLARMMYWGELFAGYGGRDSDRRGGVFSALAMLILAPLAATLIQLAISRSREYEADHTGAEITGNPMALARALDQRGSAVTNDLQVGRADRNCVNPKQHLGWLRFRYGLF